MKDINLSPSTRLSDVNTKKGDCTFPFHIDSIRNSFVVSTPAKRLRTTDNITVRLKGLLRADLQQHKLNPAKFVA